VHFNDDGGRGLGASSNSLYSTNRRLTVKLHLTIITTTITTTASPLPCLLSEIAAKKLSSQQEHGSMANSILKHPCDLKIGWSRLSMQNPPEPPNELKLSHIGLTKNSPYAYQCIGRGGRKNRGFLSPNTSNWGVLYVSSLALLRDTYRRN
jgi:hypothetical protein